MPKLPDYLTPMRRNREILDSMKGKHDLDWNVIKNQARLRRFTQNRQVGFLQHLSRKGQLIDPSDPRNLSPTSVGTTK